MSEIDELAREVQEQATAVDGAVATIQGLRDDLNNMANSATELTDLKAKILDYATQLDAQQSKLVAAMLTTPAPTPTPDNPSPTPEPAPVGNIPVVPTDTQPNPSDTQPPTP